MVVSALCAHARHSTSASASARSCARPQRQDTALQALGIIAAHGTETLLLPFPPLSTPNNKHAPPPSHRTPVYNSELGAQRCSRICSRYDLLAWALRGQRAAFSSGAAFHRSNPPRLSFTLCGCKTRCFPLSTRAETPRRCEQRAAAARSAHL